MKNEEGEHYETSYQIWGNSIKNKNGLEHHAQSNKRVME